MERDFVSWFRHQYPDLQSAYSNFSNRGLNIGQQNSVPIYMPPYVNEVPVKGDSPLSFSGLLQSKASQPTEAHNWFYCLPQLHQGFASVLSTIAKEKFAPQSVDNSGVNKEANAGRPKNRLVVYQEKALQDKERYRMEMQDYRERLTTGQIVSSPLLIQSPLEHNVDMIDQPSELQSKNGNGNVSWSSEHGASSDKCAQSNSENKNKGTDPPVFEICGKRTF